MIEFCLRLNLQSRGHTGALTDRTGVTGKPKGIDFVLENCPTSQKYLIETMGGGVALFDYNNDGLLDIFFVNGGGLRETMTMPESFDRANPKYWNRLYVIIETGVSRT